MVGFSRAGVVGVIVYREVCGEGFGGFEGAGVYCFELEGRGYEDCWLESGEVSQLRVVLRMVAKRA